MLQAIDIHLVRFISRGKTKPKLTPYPRPGKGDKAYKTYTNITYIEKKPVKNGWGGGF